MKDKNGIEIDCSNCAGANYCKDKSFLKFCRNRGFDFLPSTKAYEARIKELQDELYADNLRLQGSSITPPPRAPTDSTRKKFSQKQAFQNSKSGFFSGIFQ